MRSSSRLAPIVLGAAALLAPAALEAHSPPEARIPAVTRALNEQPGSARLGLLRATIFREAGRVQEAEADYRRALELDPELVDARAGLSALLLANGQAHLAREEAERTLAKAPFHGPALLTRARAIAELESPDVAADAFAEAVLHARRPTPELFLEWSGHLGGASRTAEALAALDRGLTVLGPAPALAFAAIDREVELGRGDRALARLDALSELYPRRAPLLRSRGDVLRSLGREIEARAAWTEALEEIELLPPDRRTPSAHALTEQLEKRLRVPSPSHSRERPDRIPSPSLSRERPDEDRST